MAKYPYLTRILSANFPKIKLDEQTRDLENIGGIVFDGKLYSEDTIIEELGKDADLFKKFIHKSFEDAGFKPEEISIEFMGDHVSVFKDYLEDFVHKLSDLSVEMNRIPDMLEDPFSYSGHVDHNMKYTDVGSIIESIKNKEPKTYEAILEEIARVEEIVGQEFKWNDYSNGDWFTENKSEINENLYDALRSACYSGHEVGTEGSMYNAIKSEIKGHKFYNGSYVVEKDGLYSLVVPLSEVIETWKEVGHFSFSYYSESIGGRRNGIEWQVEFNEDAANERFLEEIHAFEKEKGISK